MMEYEARRTMPAECRIVFNIAADPTTLHRWLPGEVVPDMAEAETRSFIANRDGTERATGGPPPERFVLEWCSHDHPECSSRLQVTDQASGTSEVVLHVCWDGDRPRRDETQRSLEESLDRLGEEVNRRVTEPGD
ncbi:hypothetical protein SMC26_14605 [Actinomadura fulvescens]